MPTHDMIAEMKSRIKSLIPAKFTYKLVDLKKRWFEGFVIRSYSEHGEDIILTKHLYKSQTEGFYVDVGAFHPEYISNTHLLHRRGWRGINIDPNPETIALFKKRRPRDINVLSGVASGKSELTYYQFENAGANTFDEQTAMAKQERSNLLKTTLVSCLPLGDILDAHVPKGTTIDILDIDVEDMDLAVLESNNWNVYHPRVVLVEDRDFRTKQTESQVYQLLYQHGYRFYAYLGLTLIMCDKESVPALHKF